MSAVRKMEDFKEEKIEDLRDESDRVLAKYADTVHIPGVHADIYTFYSLEKKQYWNNDDVKRMLEKHDAQDKISLISRIKNRLLNPKR